MLLEARREVSQGEKWREKENNLLEYEERFSKSLNRFVVQFLLLFLTCLSASTCFLSLQAWNSSRERGLPLWVTKSAWSGLSNVLKICVISIFREYKMLSSAEIGSRSENSVHCPSHATHYEITQTLQYHR